MSLSFFYIEQFDPSQKEIVLDEDTSYHIVQVLRMKPGERLQLTDGRGQLATGSIVECHKKLFEKTNPNHRGPEGGPGGMGPEGGGPRPGPRRPR